MVTNIYLETHNSRKKMTYQNMETSKCLGTIKKVRLFFNNLLTCTNLLKFNSSIQFKKIINHKMIV